MSQDVLVVLNSSRFGQGNPQLGERLMKNFLNSLQFDSPNGYSSI